AQATAPLDARQAEAAKGRLRRAASAVRGPPMLAEIPYVRRMLEERTRAALGKAIRAVLDVRFGPVPPAISNNLSRVRDEEALFRLTRATGSCRSLEEFANALYRESSPPARPG